MKNIHPRAKDIGNAKYSKGAIRLGSVNRYPEINKMTPIPPEIPIKASKSKSSIDSIELNEDVIKATNMVASNVVI